MNLVNILIDKEKKPHSCFSCIVFHCVESHSLLNQFLDDGHFFFQIAKDGQCCSE